MVSHNPMTNLPLQMDHEEVRDFLKKKAESPGDLDQTWILGAKKQGWAGCWEELPHGFVGCVEDPYWKVKGALNFGRCYEDFMK